MASVRFVVVRILTGLTVASTITCALTLEPGPYTTTCSFAGRGESECGRCIAEKCQSNVDACCAVEACRLEVLPNLDTCGSGKSCSPIIASGSPIGTCIATKCSSACLVELNGDGGGGGPSGADAGPDAAIPSQTFCWKSSGECECTAYDDPRSRNTALCNPGTVGDGVCCAEPGFPRADGAKCTCFPVGCTGGGGDTCICGLGIDVDPTYSCKEKSCCLSADKASCRCRNGTCYVEEKTVTACPTEEYGCLDGRRRVATCSP